MGDAKKRAEAQGNSPCLCGSGLTAKTCCLVSGKWFKAPSKLALKEMEPGISNPKCYLRDLGSCSEKLTREHFVSKSVLEFLYGTGGFQVSGLPWLDKGKTIVMSPKALTAKCLCVRHNSILTTLDGSALNFYKSFDRFIMDDEANQSFVVSGHDIERWLLKMTVGMAVSNNFGNDNKVWNGNFVTGLNYIDMLEDPKKWPVGIGLIFYGESWRNKKCSKIL